MAMPTTDAAANRPGPRSRDEIALEHRWDLSHIYRDLAGWEAACDALKQLIAAYAGRAGTLAQGPESLLAALELADALGQLSYRVYYYPALSYDEDQRDNGINARRQQAQILLAKATEASAWFNPELLTIPGSTVQSWMDQLAPLARYRFALEEVYRQQEHVLDEAGETLLSLGARFHGAPSETYGALTVADMKPPKITLVRGESVDVTYGMYRKLLATERDQRDRRAAFEALYGMFNQHQNTYAALYNSVAMRDWYLAQARHYPSTLAASLDTNNIPVEVVETLIAATRAGTAPLRRYHRLRKHALGLESYHLYDGTIPLVEAEVRYPYSEVLPWIIESVLPLGVTYRQIAQEALQGRWIDVFESAGKRSGAYSAGVYGVHPYILLNYNDTLDDLFTLAHELGHAVHSVLSQRAQPFVYASYTIFVAEVASTLNEALLLDYLLRHTDDPKTKTLLLQHAIDSICGTFYTQVLFADFELSAHRMVERGEPVTAERLNELYGQLLSDYYGDAVTLDALYPITWARIPHFFRSPYYVYQYATCFASSAQIFGELTSCTDDSARTRYLDLLRAGGKDHPMELLRAAGVDLSQRGPIDAVVAQVDGLCDQLEQALAEQRP